MVGSAGAKLLGDEARVKRLAELRSDGEPVRVEAIEPMLPRKASSETCMPVPQTDTGRWVEYTKGIGRTFVKELGKLDP